MAKLLRCRDVGLDCDAEFRAETIEGVFSMVRDHLQERHTSDEIPPDVVDRLPAAILDEIPDPGSRRF